MRTEVPPWRAYVCMAFLMERTEGLLLCVRFSMINTQGHRIRLHGFLKTLLVHRELYGDMRQAAVYVPVRSWLDSGIVLRVLVVLSDGAEAVEGYKSVEHTHDNFRDAYMKVMVVTICRLKN